MLANTLALNGGMLRSVSAADENATLAHAGLGHDPKHRVDSKPHVTGVEVSSDAGDDATYALGEAVRVRLTFSETVTVTGTPRVQIDFSSGTGDERWAAYANGSGTKMLEFAYEVVANDLSTDGVAVLANTLALNGGMIESASVAGENANLAHVAQDHGPAHRVDARPPTLFAAWVDEAVLTLTFDEALGAAASLANGAFTVKKKPHGGIEQTVSLSGSPAIRGATVTLTLADAVLVTDTDVKVSYAKPTSSAGNRLKDAVGNEVASFTDKPVTNGSRSPGVELAHVDGTALTITFDEALGAAASLANGAFTVKKRPQGGGEQNVSLSGTPAISGATVTLTLANAVLETDTDVKVSYTKPTSGTGNRLRDKAGNEVASFTDQAVSTDTTPPRLVRGEIDGGTIIVYFSKALDPNWAGGHFHVNLLLADGRQGTFTATGDVEVSGNKVTVELGEGRRSSGLWSRVTFWYSIPTGSDNWLRDLAGNGVLLPGNTCDVRSGRCYSSTGMIGLVDLTGPPKVTGVAVSSKAKAGRTYALGETIQVTLTFNEAMTVTGTPRVKLDLGPATGDERWADYADGSGTRTLEFAYKVAQGDASTAGVAVLENTLTLNGGTIRSASAAGDSATLAHAGLDHDPRHKVSDSPDSTSPTLSAARVDGATLTLTFDESLNATASLANGAFTVKKTPQGGGEQDVSLSGTPAISGATVTLTLANAVLETDTDVKVSYTKPGSGHRQPAEGRSRQRGGELHRQAGDERCRGHHAAEAGAGRDRRRDDDPLLQRGAGPGLGGGQISGDHPARVKLEYDQLYPHRRCGDQRQSGDGRIGELARTATAGESGRTV